MQALTYKILLCAFFASTYFIPAPSKAAPNIEGEHQSSETERLLSPLSQFIPNPSARTKINYEAWDGLLVDIILFMGPSSRDNFRVGGGSRGVSCSNSSPYRFEGNKVLYPFMKDEVLEAISDYVTELEDLGNRLDIPTLARNEQLAFWINLHNAVILKTVGENYPGPKRRPENIRPLEGSDSKLDDAKIINIYETPLSLRDIRERIVFPNWRNPDVVFAFHLGDASSPSFMNMAYNPEELAAQITNNATEYANSLRGIDRGKVSRYYHDISPWYFPDFERDLNSYFKEKMRPEVFAEYQEKGYRGVNRYDNQVADITGGFGSRGCRAATANSRSDEFTLGPDTYQFLIDRRRKIEKLRQQEWFKRGTVTIVDIETSGEKEVE